MKVSICIPEYNRIQFLLKNLSMIEPQGNVVLEFSNFVEESTDNFVQRITRTARCLALGMMLQRNITPASVLLED